MVRATGRVTVWTSDNRFHFSAGESYTVQLTEEECCCEVFRVSPVVVSTSQPDGTTCAGASGGGTGERGKGGGATGI